MTLASDFFPDFAEREIPFADVTIYVRFGGKGPPLVTYHLACGHRLEPKITCDQCGRVANAFTTSPGPAAPPPAP